MSQGVREGADYTIPSPVISSPTIPSPVIVDPVYVISETYPDLREGETTEWMPELPPIQWVDWNEFSGLPLIASTSEYEREMAEMQFQIDQGYAVTDPWFPSNDTIDAVFAAVYLVTGEDYNPNNVELPERPYYPFPPGDSPPYDPNFNSVTGGYDSGEYLWP